MREGHDISIKEQVIRLAQEDPFLTVENLAQKATTTSRYVRTILSEAGLSLNQMRKEYARRLERNLDGEQGKEGTVFQEELRITKVSGAKISPPVREWLKLELFRASALQKLGSLVSYVELITPEALLLETSFTSVRELLPAKSLAELEIGTQKAEIVLPSKGLQNLLDLPRFSQAFRLTTCLTKKGLPLALEIRWLGLEGLVLEWSQLEPELKVNISS